MTRETMASGQAGGEPVAQTSVTALGQPMPLVFSAVDTADEDQARRTVDTLNGLVGGFKLGLGLFTAAGPEAVTRVMAEIPAPLFLDLKLHDIPATVAMAVRAAVRLRPAFLTVHALGGPAMLRAAAEAAQEAAETLGVTPPRLLAVTVLTSLDNDDLSALGIGDDMQDAVLRLARLAQEAGIGGAVCAARDLAVLRQALPDDFALVVPGIRPSWAAGSDDQKRVMTPAEAARAGADAMVVGRPISGAADPREAARRIAAEIAEVTPLSGTPVAGSPATGPSAAEGDP